MKSPVHKSVQSLSTRRDHTYEKPERILAFRRNGEFAYLCHVTTLISCIVLFDIQSTIMSE